MPSRSTIMPILYVIAGALLLYPMLSRAQPIAEAKNDTVRIVLYDEPCQLPAVSNLPKRATWTENGKVNEGCWTVQPDAGVVMAYFDDRAVAAIPIQMFAKVVGA